MPPIRLRAGLPLPLILGAGNGSAVSPMLAARASRYRPRCLALKRWCRTLDDFMLLARHHSEIVYSEDATGFQPPFGRRLPPSAF